MFRDPERSWTSERRQPRDEKPLATHVAAWCKEYALTVRSELRRMIVERHHWLSQVCARQMRRREEPLDDLVQTAEMALIMAVDRFDPTYGVAFRTFVSATILGELRRHYRSTWRVHVPRKVQELHLSVSRAIEELTSTRGNDRHSRGRSPRTRRRRGRGDRGSGSGTDLLARATAQRA